LACLLGCSASPLPGAASSDAAPGDASSDAAPAATDAAPDAPPDSDARAMTDAAVPDSGFFDAAGLDAAAPSCADVERDINLFYVNNQICGACMAFATDGVGPLAPGEQCCSAPISAAADTSALESLRMEWVALACPIRDCVDCDPGTAICEPEGHCVF